MIIILILWGGIALCLFLLWRNRYSRRRYYVVENKPIDRIEIFDKLGDEANELWR
jgi:hypothetical protein